MPVSRALLMQQLDQLLTPDVFKDYCPNGLQVAGSDNIQKIVVGVTACQALLDEAVAMQADTVLVHHGYFWKGEPAPLVGMKGRRVATLLQHDINLIAYHLPLDAHREHGNNVRLAERLDFVPLRCLDGELGQGLVLLTETVAPLSLADFATRVEDELERKPTIVAGHDRPIQSLAICTGGGQDFIELAAAAGADAFLTGEASERTTHAARELGIHFIAAGHHATERYGVQALGEWLKNQFSLDVSFIDVDNPV